MLIKIAIVSLLSSLFLTATPDQSGLSPESLLQRGRDHYRAGLYAEAAKDLDIAAHEFLSTESMQYYVRTGELKILPQLETALVYLALAQSKLGRDDDARDTILRLSTAERIESSYATLPLEADALEFETLLGRLLPPGTLPPNVRLAELRAMPPVEAITPAPVPVMATAVPAPVSSAPESSPPPPQPQPSVQPAGATDVRLAAAEREAADCAAVLKAAEERIASERAAAERAAETRIATERAAAERTAETRIATERAAAERAAEERIATERAAVLRAADERIAAERVAIQRAADERIAAERVASERAIADRVAAERAAADRAGQERLAAAQADVRRNHLATLRQADAYAERGRIAEAIDLYVRLANAEGVPREVIAAAGAGLYRVGEFSEAARAFSRLGTFARGEEDLRYYHAVSLYETGNFADARKELACALPFIQVTDVVSRYQMKIEESR